MELDCLQVAVHRYRIKMKDNLKAYGMLAAILLVLVVSITFRTT